MKQLIDLYNSCRKLNIINKYIDDRTHTNLLIIIIIDKILSKYNVLPIGLCRLKYIIVCSDITLIHKKIVNDILREVNIYTNSDVNELKYSFPSNYKRLEFLVYLVQREGYQLLDKQVAKLKELSLIV